ncbi:hypothetical protein IMZ11_00750 [Microtetraspora sp. AC03309]|uniref:hypothetical protein n=1 Tax=Microtetraspora sp. AC03309 TaxID=2779376 RepID=UPI001E3769C8|nr:hypothetical protein [Microtetraspora sp. AC03309]MCC5574168.1 hypothetical protein [Microtetraspora sp. AC03309]
MTMIEIIVPAGALSECRTSGPVGEMTQGVPKSAGLGESDASRVWVPVHEQADGTWGAGGSVIRYADLAAPAKDAA